MDDLAERQWAARQRAEEVLAAADAALSAAAQRQETDWQAPVAAAAVHRAQRPARGLTEADVARIVDAKLRQATDAIGAALGQIRAGIRAEFRAEIAALRAQIDKNAEPAVLHEVLRGLAQLDARLGELAKNNDVLQRLNSLEADGLRH